MAHLNFNPLSLEDIATRRMTAVLFKESNVLESISSYHGTFSPSYEYMRPIRWQETVEDLVVKKITKLCLPESLKKQLIDTAKPMGELLRKWKGCHEIYLKDSRGIIYFDAPILEKLCWTVSGAVDYHATAEELIRSDVIDTGKKFKLACLYCLEDHIQMFWQELPTKSKEYFCNKQGRHLQSGGLGLEFWWPYIVKGEESKLDDFTRSYRGHQVTFHQYAFICSVEKGNKTATEYFFQKLAHEEKEFSLMFATTALVQFDDAREVDYLEHFPKEEISDTLCCLLSLMTHEQQMQILHEEPNNVLLSLLEWPFQNTFLEITELTGDLSSELDYSTLLWQMSKSFKNSDGYWQKLCYEFFLRIPSNFKNNFLDQECESDSYFDMTLMSEDIKALKIYFRSVDAASRARLVFSHLAFKKFENFISKNRWNVMEVCLREATLSREDKERLKETFTKSIRGGEMKLKTRNWTRFFRFLDEMNTPTKRFSEDKTPTDAKKKKLEQ